MRLIPNWWAVLTHAYSVHFGAVAFLFELIGVVANSWPLFDGILPLSPLWFALIGLGFSLASICGRFVHQPGVTNANP